MRANHIFGIFFLLGMFLVGGCASTPKETLELSEIVDQQITQMQRSHEKFVRLYYGKLRDEAEDFIVTKWIPQFLSNVVEGQSEGGKQFRQDLDRAYKLSALDWNNAVVLKENDPELRKALQGALTELMKKQNATLGMVLLDFSAEAQRQINKRRKSLIAPIDEQEAYVLDELRGSYMDLLRASTTIKAHLASVVKVNEQRDQVLNKLGVLESQKKFMNAAIDLSDDAAKALNSAEKADDAIANFVKRMQDAKAKLSALR